MNAYPPPLLPEELIAHIASFFATSESNAYLLKNEANNLSAFSLTNKKTYQICLPLIGSIKEQYKSAKVAEIRVRFQSASCILSN